MHKDDVANQCGRCLPLLPLLMLFLNRPSSACQQMGQRCIGTLAMLGEDEMIQFVQLAHVQIWTRSYLTLKGTY